MTDTPWLDEARRHLSVAEVPGTATSPTILRWLRRLNAWWNDDETPWCGVFVAQCLETSGLPLPKYWMRARDWLDWGIPLSVPLVGCVVVFGRKGGGHVGFVVGRDERGNLLVLGGNQGNKVSIAAFPVERVLGYCWPEAVALPVFSGLPVIRSATSQLSTGEA